ncbi:MAG: sensor protein [Gemmatimonadetes bacterium]|jgi:GAF domain-containing protein|nr:sensor protein [Gemmatimonadota bacterium]
MHINAIPARFMTPVDGAAGHAAEPSVSRSFGQEVERAHEGAERVAEEVLRLASSESSAPHGQFIRLLHLSSDVEHRLYGLAARASGLEAARADEHELGTALARQAAAIARIAAALSDALASDAVAVTVATEALDALGANMAAVFMPSRFGDTLEMVGSVDVPGETRREFARIPLDASLPIVAAWHEQAPVFLESLDAIRARYAPAYDPVRRMRSQAIAAVPFGTGTDVRGVFAISFTTPHLFDETERRFVVTLGQLCGQAMHRARLNDSERVERTRAALAELHAQAATDLLTRLQRVTSALCATVTDADVAEVVITEALAASGAFGGGVVVLSDDGTEFITLRQAGIQSHIAERFDRFPRATPCMARDVLEAGALFMNFEDYLAAYPTVDVWRVRPWTGARAAVPLRTQRGPIGALTFVFEHAHDFSEDERSFFNALGDQCALALERAQFLRDAELGDRARR